MSTAPSHTLYRFFDADSRLLYVGRTINPGRRWREHERRADWFESVARVTREVLPTAWDLAEAERLAILDERPLHNVVLNRSRGVDHEAASPIVRLLYSLAESAALLDVPPSRLSALVRDGVIETVTIGRRRLVPAEALTDYIERLKAAS